MQRINGGFLDPGCTPEYITVLTTLCQTNSCHVNQLSETVAESLYRLTQRAYLHSSIGLSWGITAITDPFLRWLLHSKVVSPSTQRMGVRDIQYSIHQCVVQVSLWNIAQIYILPMSTLDSILAISSKAACRCAVSNGWLGFNYEPSWDQSDCSLQSCSLNLVIFGALPAVGSDFLILWQWTLRTLLLRIWTISHAEMVRRQRIVNRSLVFRHLSHSGHNTQMTHGHDMLGHGILSNQI